MERRWTSLSALDRRVGSFFFLWDIFNIFLGAMLARRPSSTVCIILACFCTQPKYCAVFQGPSRPHRQDCVRHKSCMRSIIP